MARLRPLPCAWCGACAKRLRVEQVVLAVLHIDEQEDFVPHASRCCALHVAELTGTLPSPSLAAIKELATRRPRARCAVHARLVRRAIAAAARARGPEKPTPRRQRAELQMPSSARSSKSGKSSTNGHPGEAGVGDDDGAVTTLELLVVSNYLRL